jgi:hypothetical protein
MVNSTIMTPTGSARARPERAAHSTHSPAADPPGPIEPLRTGHLVRPELNRPSPTRPDPARPGNPWRQSLSDHALLRGEADARRRPAAVASASAAAAAAAVRIACAVAACGG